MEGKAWKIREKRQDSSCALSELVTSEAIKNQMVALEACLKRANKEIPEIFASSTLQSRELYRIHKVMLQAWLKQEKKNTNYPSPKNQGTLSAVVARARLVWIFMAKGARRFKHS